MALRLGDLVEGGELLNTKKNSVHGRVKLRGMETPLMLELTGNCDPDLAGWHFRFEPRPRASREQDLADSPPIDLKRIPGHQIGVPGTMTAARRVKDFDCSVKEFLRRCELGEPPPTRWVRGLYLEWYSQNGRVVIELADPILEFVERVELSGVPMGETAPGEPLPPGDGGESPRGEESGEDEAPEDEDPGDEEINPGALEVAIFSTNDQGEIEIRREVYQQPSKEDEAAYSHEDLFDLVSPEVQRILDNQSAAADKAAGLDDDESEAIRECELIDDLMESDADVPLCSIFDKPMRLPAVEDLDERRAGIVLKSLLSQLALVGVAFHMCEHFTALDAYRLLVEKVLWEERTYPQLRGTGWVTNFMTSEWCPQCKAEFEREYEERERERQPEAGETPPDENSQ
jgi:hypothetical protein